MEKKRILIVDDEKGVRISIAAVLAPYDYEIDLVENGVEATIRRRFRGRL